MDPLRRSDWQQVLRDAEDDHISQGVVAMTGGIAVGILLGLGVIATCVVVAVKKYDAWSYWVPEYTWTNRYGNQMVRHAYLDDSAPVLLGILGSILGGPLTGFIGGCIATGLFAIPFFVHQDRCYEASHALQNGPEDQIEDATLEKIFKALGRKGLVYGMRMTQEQHAIAKKVLGPKVYASEMQKCVNHWKARSRLEILDHYWQQPADVRVMICDKQSVFKEHFLQLDEALALANNSSDERSFLELYKDTNQKIEVLDLPQIGTILDKVLAEKALVYLQTLADFSGKRLQLEEMREKALEWGALRLADTLMLARYPDLLKWSVAKEDFVSLFKQNKDMWLKRSLQDQEFAQCWKIVLGFRKADEIPEVEPIFTFIQEIQASSNILTSSPWLQHLILCSKKQEFEECFQEHRDQFFILSATKPALCKALLEMKKEHIQPGVLERLYKYVEIMHDVKTKQTTLRLTEVYRMFGDQDEFWNLLSQQSVRNLIDLVAFAAIAPHRLPLGAILDDLLVEKYKNSSNSLQAEDLLRCQQVCQLPHTGCVKLAALVADVQGPVVALVPENEEEKQVALPLLSEVSDLQMMKRRKNLTSQELQAVFGYYITEQGEFVRTHINCPKTAQALLRDAVPKVDLPDAWTDYRCFAKLSASQLKGVWEFIEKYHDWRTEAQLVKFLRTTQKQEIFSQLRKAYDGKLPESLYRIFRTNPIFLSKI